MRSGSVKGSIGIEDKLMKSRISELPAFERTTLIFTFLLIAAGSALLLGSRAGYVSLDQIEKFWPVTLVATGLVQLLAEPARKA